MPILDYDRDTDVNSNDTQPVSNIVAIWEDGKGITLSWTAAEDVTNKSQYEIYFLDTSTTVPRWAVFNVLEPIPVKSKVSSARLLTPPSNTYFVPWSQIISWTAAGKIPNLSTAPLTYVPACVAFEVQHVDSILSESDTVSIFAFPPQQNAPSITAIHLSNDFQFDNFGQAKIVLQDTFEELEGCVAMLLGTDVGQRSMAPTYGIEDIPLHAIDLNMIQDAIREWEDRADVTLTVVYGDDGTATLNANVKNAAGAN